MSLRRILSQYWFGLQEHLFPALEEAIGPLAERYQSFVTVLEFVRVERFLPDLTGLPGRPREDRAALARAFIAKAVFDVTTTRALIERPAIDRTLRRLCGWNEVREKPTPKPPPQPKPKRKRGRPRKGEQRPPKESRRLERQQEMTLAQMVEDLPRACDVGAKRNAKGHQVSWVGYKLHIDAADGGIPVSCILSSASLHDSQVALPLATMSAARVTNLYDLMDSAYDSADIRAHSASLGHVAIIDENPRRDAARKQARLTEALAQRASGCRYAENVRYRERSNVERVNGRLKDEFGGRHVRVRGHAKVMCHLMFGIVALTVDQYWVVFLNNKRDWGT